MNIELIMKFIAKKKPEQNKYKEYWYTCFHSVYKIANLLNVYRWQTK